MTGSREKDSADFDLEAFIDLFDEALTSDDPGVQKTLQHLMVICALARNHARHDARSGPLRRMFEDQNTILRRLERLETGSGPFGSPNTGLPARGPVPLGPYHPPTAVPGAGPLWPPQPGTYPPGTIWAHNKTSTSMTLDPAYGAVPPTSATAVAERVENLLHSSYKGSSVGASEC